MSEKSLVLIERLAAVIWMAMVVVSAMVMGRDFTLGVIAGGFVNLANFRSARVVFRPLFFGDRPQGMVVFGVILKLMLLFGLVLVCGLWLKMDLIGFMVGFSAVVAAIVFHVLIPTSQEAG